MKKFKIAKARTSSSGRSAGITEFRPSEKARRNARTRVLYDGKWLQMVAVDTWEHVSRKNCTGIVIIVAKTKENKLILVEQYRPPLGKNVVEMPAGLVNDKPGKKSESFETAAKRELFEEAGYDAKKFKFLARGPVSPGLTRECVDFYLASGLTRKNAGGGDETENIKVHEVPIINIEAWFKKMAKKGKMIDPKIYTGLYFLNKHSKS